MVSIKNCLCFFEFSSINIWAYKVVAARWSQEVDFRGFASRPKYACCCLATATENRRTKEMEMRSNKNPWQVHRLWPVCDIYISRSWVKKRIWRSWSRIILISITFQHFAMDFHRDVLPSLTNTKWSNFLAPPLYVFPLLPHLFYSHSLSYLKGRGIVRKLLAFECFL